MEKHDVYAWDDTFRNGEGLSLEQCREKYGTGELPVQGTYVKRREKVIYLSKHRSVNYCWVLWSRTTDGYNLPSRYTSRTHPHLKFLLA